MRCSPQAWSWNLLSMIYNSLNKIWRPNNNAKRMSRSRFSRPKNSTWRTRCCASPVRCSATIRNVPRCARDEIELGSGGSEKTIVIRPDPKLGQPGQLAHKIFVALIKKHSDYGRPIRKEVSFTRREIGRLIGRKEWGGRDSEQLSRALHEIHYTFITTHFKKSDGRYIEHSFNIFPEILLERREFASDPIEACTITLAEPIIASLQDEHFTCLNHALMAGLGTIGQALYMRLFFHFANLYDGRQRHSASSFQKRYDDICTEWLGGLTILKHKSKIVGEQLGQHLDQLVAAGFLASYVIEQARSRGRVRHHVPPRRNFLRRLRPVLPPPAPGAISSGQPSDDRQQIEEPLKVAYLFAEKRTGHPVASIAFVPSKDVETAKQLLAEMAFDGDPGLPGLCARRGPQDQFRRADPRRHQTVPRRLSGSQKAPGGREGARGRAQEKAQQEAEQQAYDCFRRSQAAAIFASLPDAEREAIEAQARAHAAKFTGFLRQTMFEFGKVRFTIERHGEQLTAFDEWKAGAAQHIECGL